MILAMSVIGLLLTHKYAEHLERDTWTRDQHLYNREFDIIRQNYYRETAS